MTATHQTPTPLGAVQEALRRLAETPLTMRQQALLREASRAVGALDASQAPARGDLREVLAGLRMSDDDVRALLVRVIEGAIIREGMRGPALATEALFLLVADAPKLPLLPTSRLRDTLALQYLDRAQAALDPADRSRLASQAPAGEQAPPPRTQADPAVMAPGPRSAGSPALPAELGEPEDAA